MLLRELKIAANDEDKQWIQRRLEAAEREIKYYKERVSRCESQANDYEEKLGLLKKEGELEHEKSSTVFTMASVVIW